MKISPFTPLCFAPYASDGLPSRYVQIFAQTDRILVEVFAEPEETAPVAAIKNAHTGETLFSIEWNTWEMNSGKVCYFTVLSGLQVGHYVFAVGDVESDEFRVTDEEWLLERTTLIQYRFKDNKQRDDVVSVIDYMPYFFDWRVPGGFKDSGVQFGVTNEQFVTQHEDVVELYAMDYVTKSFTLGGPEGVPVWYGEMLNRVLTCNYVYFDGVRYARSESETPSMNTLVDGVDSFVFSQALRPAVYVDPEIEEINQVALRRVDTTYYRDVENGAEDNVNRRI